MKNWKNKDNGKNGRNKKKGFSKSNKIGLGRDNVKDRLVGRHKIVKEIEEIAKIQEIGLIIIGLIEVVNSKDVLRCIVNNHTINLTIMTIPRHSVSLQIQ